MELSQTSYARSRNKREMKRLYFQAFPKAERVPWRILKRRSKRECSFDGYDREGKFIGLTVSLETEQFLLLFYLAVCADLRSEGYGGELLARMRERSGKKPIVLDIEEVPPDAPEDGQLQRRLKFYLSNGYRRTGFRFEAYGVRYETLCFGGEFPAEAYRRFLRERLRLFRN